MMFTPHKTLTLLVFSLLLFAIGITGYADVTGTFGTHISLRPQTTVSEVGLIDFDVQNSLDLTFAVSGLAISLHSHFGIAGVEDVILTFRATLGAFDFSLKTISGRFAYGFANPFYDELHFVKQLVTASINLGGVVFTNNTQFEDTNAFTNPTSAYAMGNVFGLVGQTISGITIRAETGICMQQVPNSIKKHFALSPWTVNPDCATTPKPDLLFDFETVTINGVPIAPGVFVGSTISCISTNPCAITSLFDLLGSPIPLSVRLTFSDVLDLTFAGASFILSSGSATLIIEIGSDGSLGAAHVSVETALNPDTNPATFSIVASVTPGVGLTEAVVDITIQQLGMTFGTRAVWTGGPPAIFTGITFSLLVPAELSALSMGLQTSATFDATGLILSEILLTIDF